MRGKAGMGAPITRRWMRASPCKMFRNHRVHTFEVCDDVVIPEAHDPESLRTQERIAFGIHRRVHVLSAIGFDHEAYLEAGEIDDKWTDRILAAEPVFIHAAKPEDRPQAAFGGRHFAPKYSRRIAFLALSHAATLADRIAPANRGMPWLVVGQWIVAPTPTLPRTRGRERCINRCPASSACSAARGR